MISSLNEMSIVHRVKKIIRVTIVKIHNKEYYILDLVT